jgi:hypothetical protein
MDFCPDYLPAPCNYPHEYPIGGHAIFRPTSSTGTEVLQLGLDNLFCRGGAFTTNRITIELYRYGTVSFPIAHTWCSGP